MAAWILAIGLCSFGVDLRPALEVPALRVPMPAAGTIWRTAGGPGKGKFLVARRQLIDPNFNQTVVLLVEHSEEGALGLVINRPTEVKLSDVLEIDGAARLVEPVYSGGPVAHGRMLMLLRAPETPEGAQPVFEDVHSSGSRELLERLVTQQGAVEHFRVYAGHAGWAPGQLEAEIERGGWHVAPADSDLVFSMAPENVWPELNRRAAARWTRRRGKPAGGMETASAQGGRGADVRHPAWIDSAPGRPQPEVLP
jgi:putative transcriptional regulator